MVSLLDYSDCMSILAQVVKKVEVLHISPTETKASKSKALVSI